MKFQTHKKVLGKKYKIPTEEDRAILMEKTRIANDTCLQAFEISLDYEYADPMVKSMIWDLYYAIRQWRDNNRTNSYYGVLVYKDI